VLEVLFAGAVFVDGSGVMLVAVVTWVLILVEVEDGRAVDSAVEFPVS